MERPLPPLRLEEHSPSVPRKMRASQIVVYLVFGFFLALFTSENVLSEHPGFSKFADWMASIVPSINSISSISSFPEVTKFFFAMMWFLAPVVLTITFVRNQPSLEKRNISLKELFYIVVGIPLCLFISYKILTETGFSPHDLAYTGGRGRAFLTMFSQNRLMLGLIGSWLPTFVIFIAWITLGLIALPFLHLFRYFSKNRH